MVDFDKKNAIFLNETHAAIAILEMLRLMMNMM
jgi:glucan phosphorylase